MVWAGVAGLQAGNRPPRMLQRPDQRAASSSALVRASLARQGKTEIGLPNEWAGRGGDVLNPNGVAAQAARRGNASTAFGGQSYSMPGVNFPAYQGMPNISFDIPTQQAPKVERIPYAQLMADMESDPGFIKEKLGLETGLGDVLDQLKLARSRGASQKQRTERDLTEQAREGRNEITSRYSALGPSGLEYGERAQLDRSNTEQMGDLARLYQELMSDYNLQEQAARNQTTTNIGNAKENAATRRIARRVTPTEIVY